MQVTSTAYAQNVDGSLGRSLRLLETEDPQWGRWAASRMWSDVLDVEDPTTVEQDLVWAWVERDWGEPGVIDAGEQFDILLRPVPQPMRLVALGDSYSAGQGATNWDLHECARSPYSYSGTITQIDLYDDATRLFPGRDRDAMRNLVEDAHDPEVMYKTGWGSEWAYPACSGAVSRNVRADDVIPSPDDPQDGEPEPQHPGAPPDDFTQLQQLDSEPGEPPLVAPSSVNAVTMSIGGNDSGFSDILKICILANLGPNAQSCGHVFEFMLRSLNPDRLTAEKFLDQVVRTRLESIYEQIQAVVPGVDEGDVAVTIFGYPALFEYGCWEAELIGYGDAAGHDNVAWIRNMVGQLNQVIEQEATAAGFRFVEPIEFNGHGICSDDTAYIVGLSPGKAVLPFKDRSVHPNDFGWQAYTRGWVRVNQGDGPRLANGMLAPDPAAAPAVLGFVENQATAVDLAAVEPTEPSVQVAGTVDRLCETDAVLLGQTVSVSASGLPEGSTLRWGVIPLGGGAGTVEELIAGPDGTLTSTIVLDSANPFTAIHAAALSPGGELIAIDGFFADVVDGQRSCAAPDQITPALDGGPVPVTVLANDNPAGSSWDPATLTVLEAPAHGTATITGSSVVYEPADGFRHRDSFVYEICDVDGFCSSAEVEVDYTPNCTVVGDQPGLLAGTEGDDVICGSAALEHIEAGGGNDEVYPGGGGDLIDTGEGGGLVERHLDTGLVITTPGVVIGGPTGEVVVVPDGRPVLADDTVMVSTPTAVLRPLVNDPPLPSLDEGSFRITTVAGPLGVEDVSTDGGGLRVLVTADEPVTDAELIYQVCDTAGRCASATVRVTTGTTAGSAPVAVNDSVSLDPATTVTVGVLANDSDPDADLDTQSLTIADNPTNATVSVSAGAVTYSAPTGFSGSDSFSYWVCDLSGLCDQATVSVEVVPYWFGGFEPPIAVEPDVNRVKAGRAVPIKFSLGGDFGLGVIAEGYPVSGATACDSGADPVDLDPVDSPGASTLSYDPESGRYKLVWKTDKTRQGCRTLIVRFVDGTSHTALFEFR